MGVLSILNPQQQVSENYTMLKCKPGHLVKALRGHRKLKQVQHKQVMESCGAVMKDWKAVAEVLVRDIGCCAGGVLEKLVEYQGK